MRLHRLEATAFGPFADTVEVDLDDVAEGGLFLIRGATGAGKTSLLDAVAFALFADVPGARSRKGLHSDHAAPGTVPSVTVEFTASGRRLRIERSPEFSRPRRRGTGTTTVPARATLWELTGSSWTALSTRQDEIADVVQDVLGLGLSQFSKVVLLPQGEFAAFLRATPEERRGVLERLFDVTTFVGVEDWFAQRRKDTGDTLERARTAFAADLGVLTEVLAEVPAGTRGTGELPPWDVMDGVELPRALAAVTAELQGAVTAALAGVDAARSADTAATRDFVAARDLIARRTRGQRAAERLAELDRDEAVRAEARASLDAARRAAALAGDAKAADRATTVLDQAVRRVAETADDLAPWGFADRAAAALTRVAADLDAGDASLREADRLRTVVDELHGRQADLTARLQSARHGAEELASRARRARAGVAESTARLEAARAAEAVLQDAVVRAEVLSTALRLRRAVDAATEGLAVLQDRAVAQRTTAQDLRECYLDRRQARLDGMAAELAARLTPDDECPVCGSVDHPRPATAHEAVTAEAVTEAEGAWQVAQDRLAATEREAAALEATLAAHSSELAGEARGVASLAEARAAVLAELQGLEVAAAAAEPARRSVAAMTDSLAALEAESRSLQDAVTAAMTVLEVVTADLAEQEARLAESLRGHAATCPCSSAAPLTSVGDFVADFAADSPATGSESASTPPRGLPSLEALRLRHRRAVAAIAAHREALLERERAADSAATALASFEQACAQAGFAGMEAVRAAALPPTEVTALESRLEAAEAELVALRTTLDDPEVAAALVGDPPDLARLERGHEAARTTYARAVAEETLLRRSLAGLSRVRSGLERHGSEVARLEAEHLLVKDLADSLAGTGPDNTLRMRLSAYVLAARLEKVAALANERLATMGEGRYQLRHSDGLAARGARSGLGLEVLDLWTGQARDTSSLSGGESFMASLALALGLADAVREEAGGFDLQTLFVDEGFGTLDDESLEQVMAVLDDLREGGRAVGVVSHVAELRTRIPSQVIVSKTERGSTLQVTSAGASAA
jgi:DNA repair protein SbcC/Rad50